MLNGGGRGLIDYSLTSIVMNGSVIGDGWFMCFDDDDDLFFSCLVMPCHAC